jgi:tetratricopeptide (TPR) repeat protein
MTRWIGSRIGLVGLSGILMGSAISAAIAAPPPADRPAAIAPSPQPKSRRSDQFPPSPLEFTEPEPLLPGGKYDPQRPLSQTERQALSAAVVKLDAEATAQAAAGQTLAAFTTWNRELRLQRALGPLAEIKALGRVGDIAWRQNQAEEVQVITRRLQALQAQAPKSPPDRAARFADLGLAYQQVRSPQLALSIYEPLLAEARQQRQPTTIVSLLNTIGQLHLSWFKYSQAAPVYQELLTLAAQARDPQLTSTYLTQLVYLHTQAKQPAEALRYQEQLASLYQQTQQPQLLPDLQIQMGANYQVLGQLDQAEKIYQTAFTIAQATLQPAYAADALRQLGGLYRSHDRLDAALQVYESLVGVEQQAYSLYGMMDAYDQLGQTHLQRQAYPQALAAFQQGLTLAQKISYRTEYFSQKIQQASPSGQPVENKSKGK